MKLINWFKKTIVPREWRMMDTAPRDGTVVEIKCCYGLHPWYGFYHYGKETYLGNVWIRHKDPSHFIIHGAESSCYWRPIE
jgi:hypothetical protein